MPNATALTHPAAALMLFLALAGCAAGGGAPGGTWVGRLHTVAGTCPDTEDSDLAVSARTVIFVPGDGVLSLRGVRGTDPDALHAQAEGATIDRKPYPMVFDGRFADGAVTGTYGTPDCRATVAFHRPTDVGLRRVFGG